MSDTPRTDAERDRCRECGLDFVPAEVAEKLERELRQEQDAAMMAGSQNSALHLQLKDSTEQTLRLRDDLIEQCAAIADREWVGENSLIGSKVAGTIAKSIRALKSSAPTE